MDNKSGVVNPLVSSPESLGFARVNHGKRAVPRFLVGQQPQLKSKPFKQDAWDKSNQQKMVQMEENIDVLTELYERLRKMREMERKMMENKGLVDKADFAKDLNDAIEFQGTCLDMCPVFERARRNVEYTVYSYEKNDPSDKKAARAKALKVFARPAAAAAPPLPSDVRPPHVLVQTLDYIIDNLLVTLPESEGFIWDRMRSIRQDFTYQNYSGPEAIDCNERIVRIHLLILHVMAKSKAKYSMQQELEQLHKSLITLAEIYDDVRAAGGSCPNEAEFRAYALLSKIRDPQYDKTIQELPDHIFQDNLVQLALVFRSIVSNSSFLERGHIKTENCLNYYERFFKLIQSTEVPFLMASFLETYLGEIRFYAIKALAFSLNKKYKPVDFSYMMNMLLFNDEEELLYFCNYYSITIIDNTVDLKSLNHHSHKIPETKPLKQSYLHCVEEKLLNSSLKTLINAGKSNLNIELHNNPIIKKEIPIIKNNNQINGGIVLNNGLTSKNNPFTNTSLKSVVTDKIKPTQNADSNPLPSISVSRDSNVNIVPKKSEENKTKIGLNTPTFSFSKPEFVPNNSRIENKDSASNKVFTFNQIPADVPKQKTSLFSTSSKSTTQSPGQTANTKKESLDKKQEKMAIASKILAQIMKEVVKKKVTQIVSSTLEKKDQKKTLLSNYSEELYRAFLHEKLYIIYLESRSEIYMQKRILKKYITRWHTHTQKKIKEKNKIKEKKEKIRLVSRQLGVPTYRTAQKSPNISLGEKNAINSSVLTKDRDFSPLEVEQSKIDKSLIKKNRFWYPIDFEKVFIDNIYKRLPNPTSFNILVYSNGKKSVSNEWLFQKLSLKGDMERVLTRDDQKYCITKITNDTESKLVNDSGLLIFNSGVTEFNIFDLEMKLKQDGESLIKLIGKISLQSDIKFTILILYWESAHNCLDENTISQCLKLQKITKHFSSILHDIVIVNIGGEDPDKALEYAIERSAKLFQYKLTSRGEYNQRLRTAEKTPTSVADTLNTRHLDAKLRRTLEFEQEKYMKEIERTKRRKQNTYAHLQSHIMASPKNHQKKIPVLLSASSDSRYRTPLNSKRRIVSTTPNGFPSTPTLAQQLDKTDKHPKKALLALSTPSHSKILSGSISVAPSTASTDKTPIVTIIENAYENNSEDHSNHDSVLYRTPINTTKPVNKHPKVPHTPSNPTSNFKELKSLIESVKKKFHQP